MDLVSYFAWEMSTCGILCDELRRARAQYTYPNCTHINTRAARRHFEPVTNTATFPEGNKIKPAAPVDGYMLECVSELLPMLMMPIPRIKTK